MGVSATVAAAVLYRSYSIVDGLGDVAAVATRVAAVADATSAFRAPRSSRRDATTEDAESKAIAAAKNTEADSTCAAPLTAPCRTMVGHEHRSAVSVWTQVS